MEKTKILLIYTGGTMGMRHGPDGALAPERGYLTEQIKLLPELGRAEMPNFQIKEYNPLLDSSCMGPKEWAKVAKDIEDGYLLYDGFVVIMGTDTMVNSNSCSSCLIGWVFE